MSNRVPYESALSDLQSMFAGVDREVIAMLLQSNQGVMERTVENLLAITGGAAVGDVAAPQASERKSSEVRLPVAAPVASPNFHQQNNFYQQPQQHQQQQHQQQYFNAQPVYPPMQFSQPQPQPGVPIPYGIPVSARPQQISPPASRPANSQPTGGELISDDFLRPPSYFARKYNSQTNSRPSGPSTANRNSVGQMSQIDQDAILAQMLQDELFMQEIQQNPERYQMDGHSPPPPTVPQPAAGVSIGQSQSQAYKPPQFAGSSTPTPALHAPPAHPHAIHQPTHHIKVEGIAGPQVDSKHSSFSDRWNLLTAATKKKFLSLSSKLKSNKNPKGVDRLDSESDSDVSYAALGDENSNRNPVPESLYSAAPPNRYFDDSGFEVAEDEGADTDPFLALAKKNKGKRNSGDNSVEMQSFGSGRASINREPLLMEEVQLNDSEDQPKR